MKSGCGRRAARVLTAIAFGWLLGMVPVAFAQEPGTSPEATAVPPAITTSSPAETSKATNAEPALSKSAGLGREALDNTLIRQAEALAARLDQLELTLSVQRSRELEAIQKTNQVALLALMGLGVVGLAGMTLAGYFMFSSVNRLTKVVVTAPARAFLPAPSTTLLPELAVSGAGGYGPADQTSARVINVLEQLQRRIRELEQTATPPLPAAKPAPVEAPNRPNPGTSEAAPAPPEKAAADPASSAQLLFEKGMAHLNLDQVEAALRCFDEAMSMNPNLAELHVKRGAALERLERFDEALASYDRAIAVNPRLTTAHLCKGGLFGRLERFDEAVRCYDEALRTKDNSQILPRA